jgi:glycosyltransferase involved in cell wall biosynthesis
MRIGMLADVYKPHISGVTNHIALNKQSLEKAGHEVFVFTFGDEDFEDDEANIIRSPGLPLVDTGFYLSFRYSLAAQKILRTMDVVHVHHPFLSGHLALRYCVPRKIPIAFTNHTRYDLYAQFYLPMIPDVVGESLLQAYLPSFCRSCDLVIAPSAGMRDVLQKIGVDSPIEVLPNGVDLSPIRSVKDPISRSDLGFNLEDVVLIYTGRLGPEKNLPLLLRSFAGTAKAYDHIGLLIVGDGPERDNLEDRVKYMGIADRVHFTGMVPYKDLPRYLAAADAFVTASVTEVHPLSVIEAMAAGLPVLGIESPGVGDTVENEVTGLISPEPDMAIFTALMVRLVTDHECREKMGEAAREKANEYAIERITPVLVEKYERIIRQTSNRKRTLRSWITRGIDRIMT